MLDLHSMISSNRIVCVDQRFEWRSTVKEKSLDNHLLQRSVAKEVTFDRIDFKYTIFDTCYFRKCVFQNCDFTGCRFTASNFYGSSFVGCTFDYAVFERTIIDPEILDVGCPSHENLRNRFARTLRTNYQSLGDAAAVNKAIHVELEAKEEHLLNAWKSTKSYYRDKYDTPWKRFKMLVQWMDFKLLDLVWGNGESLWKLGRATAVIFCGMALVDVRLTGKDWNSVSSYAAALVQMPSVFFGINPPVEYPGLYLSIITLTRLVMIGFLMSIIIKRFGHR